jgi:hypothetical protein
VNPRGEAMGRYGAVVILPVTAIYRIGVYRLFAEKALGGYD